MTLARESSLAIAAETSRVKVWHEGSLGRVRLNRPQVMNSLDLDMIRDIAAALDGFERDGNVRCVLLDGAGPRGFCAGGDIRAIARSIRAGDGYAHRFWREEYRLNARIASFAKPVVALMDGVVMGGGVGLSAHASHRVVTERTTFAMPEVRIGFVPDVGGTWLLSRTPGEAGTCLALTGWSIGPADVLALGLADVSVRTDTLRSVCDALASLGSTTDRSSVESVLRWHASPMDDGPFTKHGDLIDKCFSADDVETIVARLEVEDSEFADDLRRSLHLGSPTSLKVTLALIKEARGSPSLRDCLVREYRTVRRISLRPDFLEGVRAAVIDKDRSPRWCPQRIQDVHPGPLVPLPKRSGRSVSELEGVQS